MTDTVERFERDGIRLTSGVTFSRPTSSSRRRACEMQIGGGAEVEVDGEPSTCRSGHVYKGLMLSDVPNVALAVGYTNASWTLRADLSARWFCSLLRYIERKASCRRDAPLRRGRGRRDPAARPVVGLRPAGRPPPATPGAARRRGASCRATCPRPRGDAAGADRRRPPRAALTALRRARRNGPGTGRRNPAARSRNVLRHVGGRGHDGPTMSRWTIQQVLDAAPDQSSVKAARSLARPGPWSDTGATDALLWGKCQGSGRTPYQVSIDLKGSRVPVLVPEPQVPLQARARPAAALGRGW